MLGAFVCGAREHMGHTWNDWLALETQAHYRPLPSNALLNIPEYGKEISVS